MSSGRFILQSPLTVDTYLDMENSTNGTLVTTTIASAATHGSTGTWQTSATPPAQLTVSTAQEKILRSPIIVAGDARYDDAAGTRSWKQHNSIDSQYMKYQFTNTTDPTVSFGFAILFSSAGVGWGTSFNLFDIFGVEGTSGGYMVCSVEDKPVGSHALMMRLHTDTNKDYGNGVGLSNATFLADMDVWYWVTMFWDKNDKAYMRIFDMATGLDVLGSFAWLDWGTPLDTPNFVAVGRYDAHTTSHINADYYIDDLIIDRTTGRFPLFP